MNCSHQPSSDMVIPSVPEGRKRLLCPTSYSRNARKQAPGKCNCTQAIADGSRVRHPYSVLCMVGFLESSPEAGFIIPWFCHLAFDEGKSNAQRRCRAKRLVECGGGGLPRGRRANFVVQKTRRRVGWRTRGSVLPWLCPLHCMVVSHCRNAT